MHAWESIQRVLDYVEDHLSESHTPEALARVAALSPFYFQRLFARLVKRPVNEYVKMRRLARACDTLADQKRRIVDIALDCGFQSHEHFTRTFKSAFKITPEEYRAHPVHLNQVMKPELLLHYTLIDENVPLIAGGIVIEISRQQLNAPERYVGITGRVPFEQASFGEATFVSGPGRIWDDFHRQRGGLSCLVPGGTELGASMMNAENDGTFDYFAGVLAAQDAPAPKGFTAWQLPAGEYVVCRFEAESFAELRTSALDKALKYLFETWLPGHQLHTQPFSAEKYTGVLEDPASMELWVLPIPTPDEESR